MTVLIWNHHKCATGFMTRVLTGIAKANGFRFGMDHRGDVDLHGVLSGVDIFHVKNAHAGILTNPDARGVHIVRNPFSVVASAYYSHLKTHAIQLNTGTWSKLAMQRERLSALSKRDGLHATIEFLLDSEFFSNTPGPLNALAAWPYADARFTTLRMEDFVNAPVTRLCAALKRAGYDCALFQNLPNDAEFSFEVMSGGRSVGQVDEGSHYRSGKADDWRNHLEPEHLSAIRKACLPVFERFYPELLDAPKSLVGGADIAELTRPDPESEMASVQIGDITLSYRANDGGGKHYLNRGHAEEYLSPFYPLLRDELSPDVCIDVGANYGYTGLLMRRAFPEAHLTLVEPIPWLENYIRHNFARNGTTFDVLHAAIVSTTETGKVTKFGVNERGTQDSRVIAQPGSTIVERPVVTLDELTCGVGPHQSVYIKIDTQGWEERVFASGQKFLDDHAKWFIKTEFAPMWLESQGTDPVNLLRYLLSRYAVFESAARVRWNANTLSDVIGAPLILGCEKDFVAYVRKLALQDRGWVDLFVLPRQERRRYGVETSGM